MLGVRSFKRKLGKKDNSTDNSLTPVDNIQALG